jgi:VRR-NUC domain
MSTTLRPRMKFQSVIDKRQVETVDLKASYIRSPGMKSAAILDGTELCRVEEFAARHFRRTGFEATFLESAPFHVLFSVYFWSLIQDRSDPRVRMVGIGARHAYDQRRPAEVVWIPHPSDFGTPDYARRRAKTITKHLSSIAEDRAELLRLFDNWLAPSVSLRQYLWAHRQESIDTARRLIELIPPVVLKSILGYLVLNYWEHYSGWPDLLVYGANQWFLAEVKSCSDKLNENQKRWIEDNHRYLRLPFKLVQVHRAEINVSASDLRSWSGPGNALTGKDVDADIGRVNALRSPLRKQRRTTVN